MKITATLSLILAMSASSLAYAQSAGMKDMDMKEMDKKHCMEMKGMKGMDMKDMDMKCKDMKGMEMGAQGTAPKAMTYQATGVVKAIDTSKGTVTLAHGPVKSLKWPAMTMSFAVKDKVLFDKLAVDKKVQVEFIKQDADYTVTAVK